MVPDRDAPADGQRKSLVDMQHRSFLDVGSIADDDRAIVRSDDGTEPNSDLMPQTNVPNDMGVRAIQDWPTGDNAGFSPFNS